MVRSGEERIFGLDILRAAAIIFVMWSHGHIYSGHLLDVHYYRWLMWDGVGLFFVLSGFLIGGMLMRQVLDGNFDALALRRFWLRRWFRTLPLYYLVLTVLVLLYYFSRHSLPPHFLAYYMFTQNFGGPHPIFFGEAWSLAVEEWFYLLLPLSVFVALKFKGDKKKQLAFVIFFLFVIGTGIRTYKAGLKDYFADDTFGVEIMKQVITRLDSIMYGVIAAWFYLFKRPLFFAHKNKLFVFGILLMFFSVAMLSYSRFFHNYLYYSFAGLSVMCLLPALQSLQEAKGIAAKGIRWISKISYALYLSNFMLVQRGILPIVQKRIHLETKTENLLMLLLFWFFSLLLAALFYRFWELPFLKIRDRITDLASKPEES